MLIHSRRGFLRDAIQSVSAIGALGALTGYAGGLERKVKLLQLESRA